MLILRSGLCNIWQLLLQCEGLAMLVGGRAHGLVRSSAHDRQQSTNQSPVSSPTASQGFTNDNRSNSSESSSPDGVVFLRDVEISSQFSFNALTLHKISPKKSRILRSS